MPKTFIFLIIGLFFGAGFGFLVAATTGAQLEGHDHAGDAAHDHAAHDHGKEGSEHAHDTLVEAGTPAPGLSITLHPDGPQSRNLEISLTNFEFDPVAVNGENVPGRGHAHVYVNGVKLGRAYGPWMHIQALPQGTHEVRVTLNANDHSQLAVDGVGIEAVETVVIE